MAHIKFAKFATTKTGPASEKNLILRNSGTIASNVRSTWYK